MRNGQPLAVTLELAATDRELTVEKVTRDTADEWVPFLESRQMT